MKLIGIDYSANCPAISIYDEDLSLPFDLNKVNSFAIFKKKKKDPERKEFIDLPIFISNLKKFNFLSDTVINLINPLWVNSIVAIEDYSFGSKGLVFTIGENCGILKGKLSYDNIKMRTYAPTLIKRFAKEQNEDMARQFSDQSKVLKNGLVKIKVDKNVMHEIFCWKFKINLEEKFGVKKYVSPLADIVDSLFILYILWMEMKVRNNILNDLSEDEIEFIKFGVDGVGLHQMEFLC